MLYCITRQELQAPSSDQVRVQCCEVFRFFVLMLLCFSFVRDRNEVNRNRQSLNGKNIEPFSFILDDIYICKDTKTIFITSCVCIHSMCKIK